jgi:hypothetical protein
MSTFKSHIDFLGYKIALFVTEFSESPIIHNSVANKVFVFTKTNIIVYVGMLTKSITRCFEKHLSTYPRFVSKISAMSTTDNRGQHNNTLDTLCLLVA